MDGSPAASWSELVTTARGSRCRWVVAAGAGVAAAAHVPEIGPHLEEAPYMGVLFGVLTGASVVLALAVLVRDTRAVYALTVLTYGLAILGYAATRLVAFPDLDDDVGNWFEPLGVVSILAEAAAGTAALPAARRRRRAPARHRRTRTGEAPPAAPARGSFALVGDQGNHRDHLVSSSAAPTRPIPTRAPLGRPPRARAVATFR